MDLFRTPGASLEGADRKSFDEIKELIDSATNDFLVRADWNANMACVDRMNAIRSPALMNEVAFLLRKKISSKSAQTVGLTMQLIGSFVSNCGQRFYAVLNDERFTRTIADAVRYFSKRPGHDSKDTTDVSLDLIQWWGEAFLPRRRDYYFIVDLYFNLRKEGLPFKPQQFDPNRVPLFSSDVGGGSHRDNTDAILAASLASEMALQDEQDRRQQQQHRPHSQDHRQPHHGREEYYEDSRSTSYGAGGNSGGGGAGSYSDTSATSTAEVVQSLRSCMMILKDMILAATNFKDFRQDEIAQDVVVQLQVYQSKMPALIEQGLMTDPEGVEALFSLNEDSQSLMAIFDKIKHGHINLVEGQRQTRAVRCGTEASETFQSVSSVPPHGQGNQKPNSRPPSRASPVSPGKTGGADLLDMDFSHFPAPPARHSPAQGTAYSHQQQHHQHHHHQQPHYPVQGSPKHGHGHASSPGRHSPHVADPFAVHHPPQQQHHQPAHYTQEAPRHTHSPHMMHPPPHPPVPAHHVEKPVAIIELPSNDPFTTDSLDALFTGTPVVHAKDPFSPDALDALFDAEPAPAVAPAVAPVAKKAQPDPFSDAALDALFDTPAPRAPVHGHAHTTHQAYATQQTYVSQQTHAHVQHGAPRAPPAAQYAPQAYHQPPVHGSGQPQAYPGGAQYLPAQQYAPRAAYPPQQQHYQQQPPHGQAYHAQAQQAYHQQQHPPQQQQQQHHARQDQASANPFDLMDS